MSACKHCHGTGVIEAPKPVARGAALGPVPPYGRDVELAISEHRVPCLGVMLFFKPDPANQFHAARDAWEMAKDANAARPGAAMVLPLDRKVGDFQWPAIPRNRFGPQIAFFAYGCTTDEQDTICRTLVNVGYDEVSALGGVGGPLTYKATRPWAG